MFFVGNRTSRIALSFYKSNLFLLSVSFSLYRKAQAITEGVTFLSSLFIRGHSGKGGKGVFYF